MIKQKWLVVNYYDAWYLGTKWEQLLPHIEFAYNRVVNTTTFHSPFEVAYGFNPLIPLDFIHFPNSKFMLCNDGYEKSSFVK